MGFIFAPEKKAIAQDWLQKAMLATKRELAHALPFAMDPVVFDYAINERGTWAELLDGEQALMPTNYYALTVPGLLRQDRHQLPNARRAELDRLGAAARSRPELRGLVQTLFDAFLPRGKTERGGGQSLHHWLEQNGFDQAHHEKIRADLREGRIGLAQNRLRADTRIEDVRSEDFTDLTGEKSAEDRAVGLAALEAGQVGVLTLAAGAGSRWTQGAGVCKALHPFCKLGGRHRTFLETHLAKSRKISQQIGTPIPHLFSTSYLTHGPTEDFLRRVEGYHYPGPLELSPGRSVGLRLIPTERDLRFAWEEMPQQQLDQQQQKVRDSLRAALIQWARTSGEAADYTDNVPLQCLHPVGHFYELPNLFRNGVLARLLVQRPQLRYLLLHNVDTCGVDAAPEYVGHHIRTGAALTFEVISRRLEDRGGGLARVNGRPRIVEGLAMPREEDEFHLSFYNSMSTWIDLDQILTLFGLSREDLLSTLSAEATLASAADARVTAAIRQVANRLPTYVTLKEVKKRWGHGQEDVFPVMQFEKLWSDLSSLPELTSRFVLVPRQRGQQLKDQAQLDGWLRDGSAAFVESLCSWA